MRRVASSQLNVESAQNGLPNARGLHTRLAGPDDQAFLVELYASTREAELALLPWADEQKAAFATMQFEAQQRSYSTRFPEARFHVVECAGKRVGRITIDVGPEEICLIEIALLSELRGLGVGSALLADLLDQGRKLGLPVTLHVEPGNPALRLYERLGFKKCGGDDFRDFMRWDVTD